MLTCVEDNPRAALDFTFYDRRVRDTEEFEESVIAVCDIDQQTDPAIGKSGLIPIIVFFLSGG